VKSVSKSILALVVVILAAGLASAQSFTPINPPPCDFSDQFYHDNGIVTSQLVQRFGDNNGTTRLTGPPATGTQHNYVADSNCSVTDPTRRNFRILATTGGNADDGNSPFSCADQNGAFAVPQCAGQPAVPETLEYISILAFLHSEAAFETSYSRTVGAINGGLDGVQQNDGEKITVVNSANPRGIRMEDVIGFFEAYAHIRQKQSNGTFALNPCAADMVSPLAAATPCFSVADNPNTGVSDVATPNLAMNWRFATNRNAMDGSDGNCITLQDQNCKHKSFSDSPFGYFCDDLLGAWIITYFWFTKPPNTTDPVCSAVFANVAAANGKDVEGYPNIITAHELNDELEANGCGAEGQEAVNGADGGAAWLICPAIPDPRNGAIAADAFLDHVATGSFLDTFISSNFTCLKNNGKFCSESAPEF
jgi:hypothetical protein